METNKALIKGGEFLIKETKADQIFIPEEFSEEQLMMKQSCLDFIEKEILPQLDALVIYLFKLLDNLSTS